MYQFNLFNLKKQLELRQGRDITWSEIAESTGIARSTLYRIAANESDRVDLKTLERLVRYFNDHGMEVDISSLFRREAA